MRSAASGETEELAGRKSFKSNGSIAVQLLTDSGPLNLGESGWSTTLPISVFDASFVQQNVFSGDVVDVENRRALYRIIVGREGVALAERESELADLTRAKQAELKAAQQAIEAQSAGMSADDYLKLIVDENIDKRIEDQKRLLASIAASTEIERRRPLEVTETVLLPRHLVDVLNTTIESIGDDAEAQIETHFASHNMQKDGQAWISKGFNFGEKDECPFCGRPELDSVPLISAYRSLFSEAYQALKSSVSNLYQTNVEELVGSAARTRIAQKYERNRDALDFWRQHCDFTEALVSPGEVIEGMRKVDEELKSLIAKKGSKPAEAALSEPIRLVLRDLLETLNYEMSQANRQIEEFNTSINCSPSASVRQIGEFA